MLDQKVFSYISDDLHPEVFKDRDMGKTMMMGSRHFDISIIITQQTPFPKGAYEKDINSNLTHRVIFKCNEFLRQQSLSMKLISKPQAIKEIFQYIKREFPQEKKRYVFIDNHPEQEYEALSIRTLILPHPGPNGEPLLLWPIVFIPDDADMSEIKREDT